MRKFYLITKDEELSELTGLTNKELWDAGVNLDDYDYFIVTPTSEKVRKQKVMTVGICPKDGTWDRLLTGCCSNEWKHIKTPKGNFYIGGAYHA